MAFLRILNISRILIHITALLLSCCHRYMGKLLGFLHLLQIAALLMQYSHSSFLTILLLWAFSGCLLLLRILNWNDLILANKVFFSSFKVEQFTFIFSKNLLTSAGNWTYFDSYLETCVFSVTTHWFFAPGNPLCFFLDLDVSRWPDILTILWNTILATENIGKLH